MFSEGGGGGGEAVSVMFSEGVVIFILLYRCSHIN